MAFAIPKGSEAGASALSANSSQKSAFKRPTKRRKPGAFPSQSIDRPLHSESKPKASSTTVSKPESDGRIPIVATSTGLVRFTVSSEDSLRIGYIDPCGHPTFVEGMCVVCGYKIPASIKGNKIEENAETSRVTVAGQTVSVSKEEGERMAMRENERLRKARKLSLVLDLDHTLVHATNESRAKLLWESNEDVRTLVLPAVNEEGVFQTNAEGKIAWTQHFVKLRPHLKRFLEEAHKMYELGVYTAGTGHYAEQICILLARHLVGAKLDEPELAAMRHELKLLEKELAKAEELKQGNSAEEVHPGEGERGKRVGFGCVPRDVKTDGATQKDVDELRSKLQEAETLEKTALAMRKTIFGSRVTSRSDLKDLSADEKSLFRIFPCGGTMAVVMDDREDVWAKGLAKTKAIDSALRKGEPPENLLLVRPYHWSKFLGFADVNNASGKDLSGNLKRVDGDVETDQQLIWSKDILCRIHRRFYDGQETENLTLPELMKRVRAETLQGAHIVFSRLIELHHPWLQCMDDMAIPRPEVVRYAQSLGANVLPRVDSSLTHVVAKEDGTDKVLAARKVSGCFVVTPSWLMECYWSLQRGKESNHLLGGAKDENPDDEDDSEDDAFLADLENELMS